MTTQTEKIRYENNPFIIATNGLTLLFKKALPVAILLIIISSAAFISQSTQTINDIQSGAYATHPEVQASAAEDQMRLLQSKLSGFQTEDWVFVGGIILLFILGIAIISTYISGMSDYTSSRLAQGKSVTIQQAFNSVTSRFFSYFWLQILIGVKIFLWSLLLIIPGFIMAVRYSLSGTAFFDKNISANAATKSSAVITKGAWLTTFASYSLLNYITLGFIRSLIQPAVSAVLYRQLSDYQEEATGKPEAHILSWLTLFIPFIILIVGLIVFTAIFGIVFLIADTGQ